jgi:hypothetical protein
MGGRGINPVNVYDPVENTWSSKEKSPIEIHHFQAVVHEDRIYLVGAMTGKYPKEEPLENIWIYYPDTDKWEKGPIIPESRRRGGAGAILYDGKIYMVCGIEYGHTSGTNNYFDSYDLTTGEWEILTKAPHVRDHFQAVVADNKLFCIGGRNTSVHYQDNFGAFFNATVAQIDYYDFNESKWYTLKNNIPVPTAAGAIVNLEHKILYAGGEGSQLQAYNNTQILDLSNLTWSQLAHLNIGRHGTSAVLYDGEIYIAAGSENKGGGNLSSLEKFSAEHSWRSLFNGKNLEGWKVKCRKEDKKKNYWKVENGMIVCDTEGRSDHNYIWLISDEEFDDFELRLKFQSSRENKGNSGIQIRSRYDENAVVEDIDDGKGWLDGPQIDIDPNNAWRNGFIYDETRGTRRWINPSLKDWRIDSAKYAPKKFIHYFEDQETGWNDVTIIAEGMDIRTIVNNVLVSDYNGSGTLDDSSHKKYNVGRKGHIALQLHMNSENKLRFKDIEIRDLQENK